MDKYMIQTPRLGLRRWSKEDLIPFAKMNKNSKVMEFFPHTLTDDESNSMVEKIEAHFDKYGFGFWAVELLDTGEFIGLIGLNIPSFKAQFTPCIEIGWRLSHEFWGEGYASEGAQACLDFGFNSLGLSEIFSFTAVVNKKSMKVMEKIGMEYVGDFLHPKIDKNHRLCKHVLYKISFR